MTGGGGGGWQPAQRDGSAGKAGAAAGEILVLAGRRLRDVPQAKVMEEFVQSGETLGLEMGMAAGAAACLVAPACGWAQRAARTRRGPFGGLAEQDLMGAMGGGEAPPMAKDSGEDTVVRKAEWVTA